MQMPTVRGLIRRRILINYRVDPAAVARHLPAPFRPKRTGHFALAGICLIRLEQIRPHRCPAVLGLNSENAAHRIAVEWTDTEGELRQGVYIVRRDTNSRLNHWAGGRVFPGEHGLASFDVEDSQDSVRLEMHSRDGEVSIRVDGQSGGNWSADSVFPNLASASRFYEAGSLGYSCSARRQQLDGLVLVTKNWHVEPFQVSRLESSFFTTENGFPVGSAEFDHALIMRDIEHEWRSAGKLCA